MKSHGTPFRYLVAARLFFDGGMRSFSLFVYATSIALMAFFWVYVQAEGWKTWLFVFCGTVGYAAFYTVVAIVPAVLFSWLSNAGSERAIWRRKVVGVLLYASGTLLLLGLYADYRLYTLYEFHFNGFVWNLISTSGGFAALGMTDSALFAGMLLVVGLFLITGFIYRLSRRFSMLATRITARRIFFVGVISFLCLATSIFAAAYSVHTGQENLLQAGDAIPVRIHVSAKSLLKRLGVEHAAMSNLRIAGGKVNYPAIHLAQRPGSPLHNVIVLVGESFRWDLLSPEITPNLWKFSSESQYYTQHYSGGNRTRMGLFSMFYGLYSPYWYSFERQRVAPALMNFMREHDYQLALHTSQSFDYPELRHTLFAGVSEEYMQEIKKGEPWRRDKRNIDDLIGKLENRDRSRAFFGFMFFESTHAPYNFPEEAVIRPDYVRDLNYMSMDLGKDIEKIHARYINAAHHIDAEAGRLINYLRDNEMLDNTIVLFTGDHGEEFMENGHWGHGHGRAFPEQQIHVPLLLHVPGKPSSIVQHRTSHTQISPTLLEALGVTQDVHSYSSAANLRETLPYFVAGDYDYMTVFDEHYKITFPFTGSDYFRYTVLDETDHAVSRKQRDAVVAKYREKIDAVVAESRRFVHAEEIRH